MSALSRHFSMQGQRNVSDRSGRRPAPSTGDCRSARRADTGERSAADGERADAAAHRHTTTKLNPDFSGDFWRRHYRPIKVADGKIAVCSGETRAVLTTCGGSGEKGKRDYNRRAMGR